jgi:serine/threonine protein kinase
METYKINCGRNLLLGYESIKASEETSNHQDDFVHVVLSYLKDYEKPVVVKVYDEENFHLPIERSILKAIQGYRNTAELICDFSCNDDKNRYITKIKKQIRFCGNGLDKLHFFVYEYIERGDVSDFLSKTQEVWVIKSFILQLVCVIMELAMLYRIYHGDINSGNILIASIDEGVVEYRIEEGKVEIESYGIMPKMIDYGRSHFYRGEEVSKDEVWFDIVLALGVVYHYIQNVELKRKVLSISTATDKILPSLRAYYEYVYDVLG